MSLKKFGVWANRYEPEVKVDGRNVTMTAKLADGSTSVMEMTDVSVSGSDLFFTGKATLTKDGEVIFSYGPFLEHFTKSDVDKATKKLEQQKPLLKKFVMDQVFNEMEKNQSAIAPYYAGDVFTMMDNNEDLVGVLPKEGSNLFVDNMCIPKNAQNVSGAEKFIDFMTRVDVSAANSEYITYASPVKGAREKSYKELRESELVYPSDEYLEKCYTFRDVDKDVYTYMQEQFVKLMS